MNVIYSRYWHKRTIADISDKAFYQFGFSMGIEGKPYFYYATDILTILCYDNDVIKHMTMEGEGRSSIYFANKNMDVDNNMTMI